MKKSRIFLTIITLTLVLLVFTGCKGVVPPSPGTTEDITVISGKIKMPLTCCAPLEEISKDGGNNNDCDEVEFWPFTPNAVVELRSAAKGQCKKPPVTTYTDEDGNYVFEDVKPGLYIITAYCPEEAKKGFFLKDVAEKIHGVALDAGIPDCTSTSLALVIEKINNCYNDWYHCYNKLTKIYKLIDTIAKDVGKVDIAAIINHDKFGDYCDDVNDDLVDLVCAFSCCESPGATGGGGGGPTPDPCADNEAPKVLGLQPDIATVGEKYVGQVIAQDAEDDEMTFAFADDYTPPKGMEIDSETGEITWNSPTFDDICICKSEEEPVPSSVKGRTVIEPEPEECKPIRVVVSDKCNPTPDPVNLCLAVTDPPKYPVTYNLGGAPGIAPTEPDHYAGDKFDLAKKPSWPFHIFTGWKCDDDDQTYDADEEYTMPAKPVNFTAQWRCYEKSDNQNILITDPDPDLQSLVEANPGSVLATMILTSGSSSNNFPEPYFWVELKDLPTNLSDESNRHGWCITRYKNINTGGKGYDVILFPADNDNPSIGNKIGKVWGIIELAKTGTYKMTAVRNAIWRATDGISISGDAKTLYNNSKSTTGSGIIAIPVKSCKTYAGMSGLYVNKMTFDEIGTPVDKDIPIE